LDSVLGPRSGSAPKGGGGGGLFSKVMHLIGGPTKQIAGFLNPANQASGLLKLADSAAQAVGVAPTQVLEHAKGIDPFYHENANRLSGSLAQAVTGAQQTVPGAQGQPPLVVPGQRGLSVIKGETPAVYGAAAHIGKTAQGLGQLPVAGIQAAAQQSTAPLTGSILGQRVHNEGVVGAGLSTLGDTLALTGAASGVLGGAGAGD